MTRRNRGNRQSRSAADKRAHASPDASQTISLAGEHKTRGFPSQADGSESVSSYALSQPNSIMTSLGGRDITDHGRQQANVPATSAWSKPLRIAEVSQPSKKDVVTKMPIRQSTQQRMQRTDPPMAQAKPAPGLGKKAGKEVEKKKRKPFYKDVKKEIRGPAYWKDKAAGDARLLIIARGIWREELGKKVAEYRRRRAAKKCKRRRRVSHKWMQKKEGMNRKARHEKQNKRQRSVQFNKSYANKLRVGYLPKNIRPLHRRRFLGRREKAILKRKVEESKHILQSGPVKIRDSMTRVSPARKEEPMNKTLDVRLRIRTLKLS